MVGKDYDMRIYDVRRLPHIISIIEKSGISGAIFNVRIDELNAAYEILKKYDSHKILYGLSVSQVIRNEICSYELIWFIDPEALHSCLGRTSIPVSDFKSISYSVGLGAVNFMLKRSNIIANSKEEYIKKCNAKYMSIYQPLLDKLTIDSIQMDSTLFNLEEMEFRGDISMDYGLKVFGGSSTPFNVGKFAFNYCYDELNELELRSI